MQIKNRTNNHTYVKSQNLCCVSWAQEMHLNTDFEDGYLTAYFTSGYS